MTSYRPGPAGNAPKPSYIPYKHRKPHGAPVKEEVDPFGNAVKTVPEGPDVKYMLPGDQVKQEADIKPPTLQEDSDKMAFADQSQGRKRRWGPPFKDEDSIPKRSRFEEVHFEAHPQDDSDQSGVALDTYNSDLSLKIEDNHLSASPISGGCFSYMWHGVRATYGFTRGRVFFEVTLEKDCAMAEMEIAEQHPHVLRIGWSLDDCGYTLGEEPYSWGYGGTGKASTNLKFKDYGCKFKTGDVVGAYLDLDMEPAVMSFTVNGNHQGIAYELRKLELKGRPIFPHVLTKNIRFVVNFGDSPQPMASVLQGYTFVGKVPLVERVRATTGPASKKDCEALMMIGLPASGKTTWVQKYTRLNKLMKYNVLGSNDLLDKMKVDGLMRKRNYSGRWDKLIQVCMRGLEILMKRSYNTPRNYIIDQTNVYQSARKRKMKGYGGFRRRAIVICPTDEDLKARTAKREKLEGKDVPDEAVAEMKANFTLPDDSETFDSVEYIEVGEKEARSLLLQYKEEVQAGKTKRRGTQSIGGRGRGWDRNSSADSFNPAGASEFQRGGRGFARGGRGTSSFDRLGGFARGGGPDRISRGGGPDGSDRGGGSDNFSRGGGSDTFTRGDGGESNQSDFARGGISGFNQYGGRGGFNRDITHSIANRDASEDLSGNGPDCFNRGGIADFGRGRGVNNASRGRVSDRFGLDGALENINRSIPTDNYNRGGSSDRYSGGNVPDSYNRGGGPGRFSRGGGTDTYGQGGGPETSGRDAAPDTYGRGGASGSDTYGRGGGSDSYSRGGVSDSYNRGGGSDSYNRGGGSDSNSRGGGSDSYSRGGGSDSYNRGGESDSYSRGGGSDSYNRGGGSDSNSRGGGSDSYNHGGGSDSNSRGGGSDSYNRGGGSDSYNRGGGSDSYNRGGGSDSYNRGGGSDFNSRGGGSDSYSRGGGPDSYSRGGGPDSYSRGGGSDSYSRGGGSDSYSRGGGSDSYNRGGGSDSYSRGGGSDSYSRGGGSDSYSRGGGSDSYSRGGGSDSYSRGGGSDSHGYDGGSDSFGRGGGHDSYGRGGGNDSYGRGGGTDTHGRSGSDSLSGGTTRFARDGDAAGGNRAGNNIPFGRIGSVDHLAAGSSHTFQPNDFNPVEDPYNRDSQSSCFSQERSAGLGDDNGRGSSSYGRGDYGNFNRSGEYGNAADVEKYPQSSEYRAPDASSSSWNAGVPPPALDRGDALPWKASLPPSAPVSTDWAAPGYPPPTPQQQVWSSQPQSYGGYQS